MIFNSLEAIPFPDSAYKASGVCRVHLLCNFFLFNLHILGFFFFSKIIKVTHQHCKKTKEN